jgi:hypothetical protein
MRKLILLLFVIIASCRPVKTVTEYKEVVRVDTFKIERSAKILPAVHDTLIIDNPCDSSGILSTFYSKIKIPQGQVVIRSVRGKIQASVDIDSIAHVYEDKYRSKSESSVHTKNVEIIKYRVPTWAVITILIESLVIAGFIYLKFLFRK